MSDTKPYKCFFSPPFYFEGSFCGLPVVACVFVCDLTELQPRPPCLHSSSCTKNKFNYKNAAVTWSANRSRLSTTCWSETTGQNYINNFSNLSHILLGCTYFCYWIQSIIKENWQRRQSADKIFKVLFSSGFISYANNINSYFFMSTNTWELINTLFVSLTL